MMKVVRDSMKYMEAYFSQIETMSSRINKNSSAAKGACHNFSLHWLRLVLSDSREFPRDRLTKIKGKAGGANPLLQYVYNLRFSPEELTQSDQMILRLRGLKSLDPILGYSTYFLQSLLSNLAWIKGAFIYSFWFDPPNKIPGTESEGHSIAFYRTSVGIEGFIFVYDPNYGEFHVLPEDFVKFWPGLMANYGSLYAHLLRQIEIDGEDYVDGKPSTSSRVV